jgi:branched-chain amino acid aminotransferase
MAECRGNLFIRNGQLIPVEAFDNSIFNRPHYIYEVFRVIDGVALFLEDHLERLYSTVALSGFSSKVVPDDFVEQVYRLIEANQLQIGNIKVVVLTEDEISGQEFLIYVMEHHYPTDADFELGVALGLHRGLRLNPNAKVMDTELRSNTNVAKQQNNVFETLLVDHDNCITEGSRSNVFFVKGDELVSPPMQDILPGITLKHVLLLCHQLGIAVKEEKVAVSRLPEFDGVFITGTSRKVLPAFRVEEFTYTTGLPVIRRLQEAFNNKVAGYVAEVLANKTKKG